MYHILASRFVFPLYERLKRGSFWSGFLRLKEAQWLDSAALEEMTFRRLRPLLFHAYDNIPYYHELFDASGITPSHFQGLEDLGRLPVTTKQDLREGFPSRVTLPGVSPGRVRKSATSGSTAMPFEFFLDLDHMDLVRTSYLFFWDLAGIGPWTPQIRIAAPPHLYEESHGLTKLLRRSLIGEQRLLLGGKDATLEELVDAAKRIGGHRGYYLWTFPSYAARLAGDLLDRGDVLPVAPLVVISYAETLTEGDKELMARAFRCHVVNHYGLMEAPFLAQTCPDNPEVFHVNCDRVVLRVVREDGSLAERGERGRIVITDLTNYVMPFINYDTGDFGVAGGPCKCGRGLPALASLDGRAVEVIRAPDGSIISSGCLGRTLDIQCKATGYIREFQAVQTSPDRVDLKVVPGPGYSKDQGVRIQKELEHFLGHGMIVRIEPVERIEPESSGKRMVVKSEL